MRAEGESYGEKAKDKRTVGFPLPLVTASLISPLIRVDCTDKSGMAVADWLVPAFEGDIIEFGDDYKKYVTDCRIALRILIDELKTLPQGVPRDGDPGDLSEAQVVQIIREAVLEATPGLGAALSEAANQFGVRIRNEVFGSLLGVPEGGKLAGKSGGALGIADREG